MGKGYVRGSGRVGEERAGRGWRRKKRTVGEGKAEGLKS